MTYINYVLHNDELKKKIQENARKYGRKNTWDTRADEWFRLLGNEN